MGALRLIQVDFDRMENSLCQAICTSDLGTFVDEPGLTAVVKIERFLAELPPMKLYEGWNGQTYPQFKTEAVVLR